MTARRGLLCLAAVAVLCALVATLVPLEVVRVLATLPLTLFLPGFALTLALFGSEQPDNARTGLLAASLSLVLLVAIAFPLSVVGIYPGTWAIGLTAATLLALAVAARRLPPGAVWGPIGRRRVGKRDLGLLGGTLALGVAAIVLSQASFAAKDAETYTALWMLPGTGGRSVEVGVLSAEREAQPYLLEVKTGSQGRRLGRAFRLAPGHEETFRVPIAAGPGGERVRVTASLYAAGGKRPYRRVVAWVPGREP